MDPIMSALDRLGIRRDGVLLVHNSFRQFGRAGHHPQDVLQSLLAWMAKGTLLMPSMSWRYVNASHPKFDARKTPSNNGILTELFRNTIAVQRSLHPTHSVCGKGDLAEDLLVSHALGHTPCSDSSPFGLLRNHHGQILMLGIGMDCCTNLHHVEEVTAPDIYCVPQSELRTYECRDSTGKKHLVKVRHHRKMKRNYWRFQDLLAQKGLLRSTLIDGVPVFVFEASDLYQISLDALRTDPYLLLAKPGERYRLM